MTVPERFGVVFDVDDTLYLEADYVRSGFRAVAELVATGGEISSDEAFDFLIGCFERGVRGNTFDLLLKQRPGLDARFGVSSLVEAYRNHRPQIDFVPGMRELIDDLRARGALLAAITDGPLQSQSRKVEALGLAAFMDPVVLTDRWGREFWKPHPRAFELVAKQWAIPAGRLAYVGDNPGKDFVAPNRLGWSTVRLRLPGQVRVDLEPPDAGHAPGVTVSSIEELELSLG